MSEDLADRLEMLLVLSWLEDGAREDRAVPFSVTEAASELNLDADRDGLLSLMAALSELESRGVATVSWSARGERDGRVTLAEGVVAEARRLFGRT